MKNSRRRQLFSYSAPPLNSYMFPQVSPTLNLAPFGIGSNADDSMGV